MAVLEISELPDRVLATVRSTQGAVADTVKSINAKLPAPPYPEQLPKPAEVVDQALGFASQVVEAQRAFVTKVVDSLPIGEQSA